MIVLAARHLLPVSAPPVHDGAVAIGEDGRIATVGRRREVRAAHPGAEVRDLGDVALLPGLVNAHAHLELSWARGRVEAAGDYMAWVRGVVALRGGAGDATVREAAAAALAAAAARGTVAVGDVGNGTTGAGVLARSGLDGVAFHELIGFRSADAERLLDEAATRLDAMDLEVVAAGARGRVRIALTAHAAHSTSASLLRAVAGRSAAAAAPLSLHVAESEPEVALLVTGKGPMADFLRERGAWEEGWRAPGQGPVEYLDRLGVLTPRTLVVHAVRLGNADLGRLQARGATVVTCPRSNAALGVGRAPIPKILGSGIPVALGTDSLLSAPDLDLLAEMAALRSAHPGLSPAAVLRMATLNGARALGLADLGAIEPGRRARLVAVPLPGPQDDPLEVVTSDPPEVVLP